MNDSGPSFFFLVYRERRTKEARYICIHFILTKMNNTRTYVELFHNQNKFLRIKRQNKRLYSDESIFRYTPAVLFILRIYSDTKKTKKCAPIIISQNKAFLILFFLKCY